MVTLSAIGIGAFGPLSPDPRAPDYGFITSTPKPGWTQTDMAGIIGRALGTPVGFDTDVNAAALGEGRWGAAQGLTTFLYLTIGTGIGGGGLCRRCGRQRWRNSVPQLGQIIHQQGSLTILTKDRGFLTCLITIQTLAHILLTIQ